MVAALFLFQLSKELVGAWLLLKMVQKGHF
jgi:hypothetical protein